MQQELFENLEPVFNVANFAARGLYCNSSFIDCE